MKNIIIMFTLAFCALSANAIETEDFLTLTPKAALGPGSNDEKFYVTVSLDGNTVYSWLQADIVLPEGIEPIYENEAPRALLRTIENGMFTPTRTQNGYDADDEPIYITTYNTHSISAAFHILDDGKRVIRVGITNTDMAKFAKTSGELFRFYIKATPYAKPQQNAISLENVELITSNSQGYEPKVKTVGVEVTANATCPVSVSSTNKWGTLMLPFDAKLPGDLKAYSCNSTSDQNLILTPVNQMLAFTPYIIYSEDGYNDNLTGTVNNYPQTDIVTDGYLNASVTAQTITQGYVMQKVNEEVMFCNVNSEKPVTVPAGKCWVQMPALGAKPSYGFAVDNATCTSPLTADEKQTDQFHTINGMTVNKLQQGAIFIHNGKKYTK